MKVSDYIVDFLVERGVTHVFEVCGGMITHLLDSLHDRRDIATISVHHEQAAAFAAEGYARVKGGVGVAMATSGPGATNLVTGIASCFFDSVPCVFVTGQVNTYEFKPNQSVRQGGFQETDIVSVVRPLVKQAVLVKDPRQIRYYLEQAFYIAREGRPGPVLLDIPMNVQRADIDPAKLKPFIARKVLSMRSFSGKLVQRVVKEILAASRPVVLLGGGARLSGAQKEILTFIKRTKIPVVLSLMGLDAFPHDDPAYVGMIGTYGNRSANLTIANADLVLALGTRLDVRQTGTKPETFARAAKIVHVDIDPRELNSRVKADLSICADVKSFLDALLPRMAHYDPQQSLFWRKKVADYKGRYSSCGVDLGKKLDPNKLMKSLSGVLPRDSVLCVDIGQHQMWAAQSLELGRGQRFLTQGGLASMGSALSLAIGVSFADPRRTVVVITGDGGFQLNLQELQTIYDHQLPIKIILLNNKCYGMVRQFQEQYFKSRFQSTVMGYGAPNFQDVVSAYKIEAHRLSDVKEAGKRFTRLFATRKPSFLEVEIAPEAIVSPKLSVNRPIEDQEPFLDRQEFRENMIISPIS